MEANRRRARVLVCDRIADAGLELLRNHADVEVKTGLTQDELLKVIGDYEAVVVRSATKIKANAIESAHRLKVIGRAGAGLDNIDVEAAQKRGIQVVNCPDANTRAVAEHAMALILALARRLPDADASLKEGRWEKRNLTGTGLYGKTLGIIGFGRIGREVAARAQAFGMKILVNQRRPTPELNLEAKVQAVDLDDLLAQSDFVSLHVPAKPETEGLISAGQLALMKPTAYLLNTARGSVINEADLLDALNQGAIAGAALDVFALEPAIDNALARHPQVIATPHVGASTEDAQNLAATAVAEQIIDIIRDVPPVENPLSLRVVSLDSVTPHENTDPHRVERLARRLSQDGRLVNPPLVVADGGRYIVLDGATRVAALKQMNIPHLAVQIVSPEDNVELRSWTHVIRNLELGQLLEMLNNLPQITVRTSNRQCVLREMVEYGGLCYLHTVDDKFYLFEPAPGLNKLEALNRLTEIYIEAGYVTRALDANMSNLRNEYPDMAALMIFPEYTVEQIIQIVRAGHTVPAGITRFIVSGRVLRINLGLDYLQSEQSLLEKNKWLREFVIDKLGSSEARYYAEPVYLMDE